MSICLILTPVIVASWPAITAAAASAAAALGLAVKESVQDAARASADRRTKEDGRVEIELAESQVQGQDVVAGQDLILTRGTVKLRVRRNEQGGCSICAEGAGHTKAELRAMAEEFSRKLSQCLTYNKVMTELRTRGFQVVNEERMEDETVRIHIRRWEG
jgi:hypothetical protein